MSMSGGGGMALQDAVVPAECIRDASAIEKAFKAFMTRRFDRVSSVVRTNVKLSELEQAMLSPIKSVAFLGKAFATLSEPFW